MIVSSIKDRTPQINKNVETDKINISFLGLLSFLCGLPSFYTINLMGELYATEAILPVLTIILLLSGKEKRIFKEKIFWAFVFSTVVMIIGYIISDLIAGTSQFNYLRAWGRNAVLFSDIVSLSILVSSDKRYLWWYVFGLALGSLVYLHLTGVSFTGPNWKLAYSQPIFILGLISTYFIPNKLSIILIIVIGVFSFYMDSRSFSIICILVGGVLWVRQGNTETYQIAKAKGLAKIILAGCIGIYLVISIMALTQEDFGARRDMSSIGRAAALRIGLIAIMDSPIIGYGSWGEGTKKYATMLFKETESDMRELGARNLHQGKTFLAHSQVVQSWMEGGILAAQLFIYYGYKILAALKIILLKRRLDYMTGFYSYFLISAFWGLFMNPYAGIHRLGIAFSIAIICTINVELTKKINSLSAKNNVRLTS